MRWLIRKSRVFADENGQHLIFGLDFLWLLFPAVVFVLMAGEKYLALHSSLMDLGILTWHFYGIGYLGEWSRAFFGHAQPFLLFYSWLYSLLPSNIAVLIILSIQGLFLVLPIYWLRQRHGWIAALAYLLYFPLWFNGLFDFHMDHLAVPLLMFFFFFVDANRLGWAAFAAIALALVKEPFALQTAACGIYLIVSKLHLRKHAEGHRSEAWRERSSALWIGVGLIVFGLGYFYTMTYWVFPAFLAGARGGLDSEAFSWLGQGFGDMVWNVLTHPLVFVEEIVGTPGKVIYLLALFGALGFIPLLHPGPLLVAVPILAISMLSRLDNYYGLGHHYTAGLIAPMLFAFIGGLPRARMIWWRSGLPIRWFVPVLVAGLLAAHVALAPSPLGRLFWSTKVWSYNYEAYIPTERDTMIKAAIEKYIPVDPTVTVSTQNTLNWAPLVERRHFLMFPQGVTEAVELPVFDVGGTASWVPKTEWLPVLAEYVVLDEKRPWFVLDKDCGWYYGRCSDELVAAEYRAWVAKARKMLKVVFDKDGFVILHRSEFSTKSMNDT